MLDAHVHKTEGLFPKGCAEKLPTINLSPRRSTPEPLTTIGRPVPSVTPLSMKTGKRRRTSTLMDESVTQLRLERRSCFSRAA